MERKRNSTRLINKTHLCWSVSFFTFLLSIFTLIFSSTIITCLDTSRCSMFAKADTDFQELEEKIGQGMVSEGKADQIHIGWPRRLLLGGTRFLSSGCTVQQPLERWMRKREKEEMGMNGQDYPPAAGGLEVIRVLLGGGPGSFPPRCTSKCGNCTPCKPVHVTVPPGTPVTAEYYPEAWRCKCGNKYYMP